MKRRLLSALLALCMLLTMAPTVAFAANGDDEGAVSSNSVYEIRTDTQLREACAVGGIYKLAKDVAIQETVKIEKSIQLDFDKHAIRQTGTGGVIRIESAIPTDVINVELKNGTITGGNADSGAGVYIIRGADVTIQNCVITGNTATGVGGAIHQATQPNNSNTCTLVNTRVTNNSATSGGGISLGATNFQEYKVTSTLKLESGTVISDNSATKDGGAIYLVGNGSRFEMNGAEITDNHSGENGGGIYSANWRGLSINSGKITGNRAQNGGGIYIENVNSASNPLEDEVLNVGAGTVITDNTAENNGGGIFAGKNMKTTDGVTVNVSAGAALYNNTAGDMADDLYSSNGVVTLPAASQMSGDRLLKSDNVTITGWYYDGREPGDIKTKRWSSYVEGALDVDETIAQGKPVYGEGGYFYKEYTVTLNDDTSLLTLKAAHGEASEWDISKSKTATNLDENYESEVTLSLPAAEEELVSDVVFVLDKSTSADVEEQLLAMLKELNEQVTETDAKVKIGVVIFNKLANRVLELTELNTDNMPAIEEAIETEISSGTNTHAGLLAGKEMLDADTEVAANRKYMVFVSDGITYIYNKEPTATAWSFNQPNATGDWHGSGSWGTFAGPDNWYSKYHTNEAPTIGWSAWLTDISEKVSAQGTTYEYKYDDGASTAASKTEEDSENWDTAYAMSIDKALYLTNQVYQEMQALGYNCYAMTAESASALSNPWATSFMSYLADGKTVNFKDIQNDIYYLLDKGSRVEDHMGYVAGDDGYNFDFVNNASALSMKVGDTELTAKEITENKYGFGNNKTGYDYVLTYVPDEAGEEHFVWEINVPVSNFAPVQLTYTVKLTNPQNAIGTYGQYDKDGSENYSDLYTNNSATLYPVDSNGDKGIPEEFAKPTVSYTIGASDEISITPADITIYTGGEGYDSVVNGTGNEIGATNNGLPTPGFYINLPDDVNKWLLDNVSDEDKIQNAAGDYIVDLSKYLTFTYDDGQGTKREWTLERYDMSANGNNSMAYNQFIYRIKPAVVGNEEIPIRLQFTDSDGAFMTTDDFTVQLNELYHVYDMSIYPGDLNQELVKAVISIPEKDEISCDAVVKNGELTVRGVTDNGTHTTDVVNTAPTEEVSSVTAQVNAGTKFTINGSALEVQDPSNVKLLVDSLVTDTNNTLVNSAVNEFDVIPDDYDHETRYLDLVDTSNGNVYVTASDTVTVYWAYPEGTDKNTEFHLVHYEGLDRNNNDALENGTYNMELYSVEEGNLENTDQGIKIKVDSFSPFALFWEDDNGGSSGGGGNNKPDDLNTEDHFAYIIGYPKDYRTGEPTDDESLWPVEPQGNITRAEVATIFFRMLTDEARSENWSQTNSYTDVASTDWYNNAISTLSNMGIISGDPSGAFRPDDSITRAEFTKIAVGFFDKAGDYVDGTYDDVSSSDWYADFIDAAVDLGLIEGYPDGTIRPEATITRAEACTIVNRTLGRVPDKDHLLPADEMRVWPDNSDTDEWYYAQIQEATNSHDYEWIGEENDQIENWTEKLEDRDWAQLEREWSDANSAPGGEVVD